MADAAALTVEVGRLLRDEAERAKLAAAAAQWHRENTGAVERTLEIIRRELALLPAR